VELRLARTFDAIAQLHAAIAAFCAREAVAPDDEFAGQLAAEELFTNLVKYNAGGREAIRFALERQANRLALRLVDPDAARFDPAQVPPVDVAAPLAERRAGGLGLHLVRAYVDELTYRHDARTLTITARRTLEAGHV